MAQDNEDTAKPQHSTLSKDPIPDEADYSIHFVDRGGKVGWWVEGFEKHEADPMLPLTSAFMFTKAVDKLLRQGALAALVPVICELESHIETQRQIMKENTPSQIIAATAEDVAAVEKGQVGPTVEVIK